MGEAIACAHCRRPIAATFAKCPFCAGEQPKRAPEDRAPIKCATCGRPYNRSFTECPFCARGGATYREPAVAPSSTSSAAHEEFRAARREVEEAEARGKRVLGAIILGGLVAMIFAMAASRSISAFGHGHLRWAFVFGLVGGAAGAWFARRLATEDNSLAMTIVGLVFGYLMFTSIGYLGIVGLNAFGGTPSKAVCTVTRISYAKRGGAAVTAYFKCRLPSGEDIGGDEHVANVSFKPSESFTLTVRRGALGIWTFDPESARALTP